MPWAGRWSTTTCPSCRTSRKPWPRTATSSLASWSRWRKASPFSIGGTMSRTISRRTILRGAGAAIALPWLEAMAGTPQKAPLRLAWIYVPMGVHLEAWIPTGDGAAFELGPTMEPLRELKSEILVFTGLDHRREDIGGNPHP